MISKDIIYKNHILKTPIQIISNFEEDGYKVLLWLYGPWKTFKNYDANVIGKILEQPK